MNEDYERIWDTVLAIPEGRVSSYGRVAIAAGLPGRARLVGRAMRELPSESGVPWFRVINAAGRISFPAGGERARLQRDLLEQEGVVFDRERVDLQRFGWPDEE